MHAYILAQYPSFESAKAIYDKLCRTVEESFSCDNIDRPRVFELPPYNGGPIREISSGEETGSKAITGNEEQLLNAYRKAPYNV